MNLKAAFYIIVTITMLSAHCLLATDHPAEAAAIRLNEAKDQYSNAEKEFLRYVDLITDKAKRDDTLRAFKERKELWTELSEIDSTLKIAASPLPDTSTNSSLVPYWTEIQYLNLQIDQLKEQASSVRQNWGSKGDN